jgi:hypothetical protein
MANAERLSQHVLLTFPSGLVRALGTAWARSGWRGELAWKKQVVSVEPTQGGRF